MTVCHQLVPPKPINFPFIQDLPDDKRVVLLSRHAIDGMHWTDAAVTPRREEFCEGAALRSRAP
jgi:hypothetical protein